MLGSAIAVAINAALKPLGLQIVRRQTIEALVGVHQQANSADSSRIDLESKRLEIESLRSTLDHLRQIIRERNDRINEHESTIISLQDNVARIQDIAQKATEYDKRLNPNLLEVEERYVFGTGSFLERDLHTHTFTNMELESARLLYSLVLLGRPRVVVETGTHQGYSATYAAQAMIDAKIAGHVWTIDPYDSSHLWENTNAARYVTWLQDISFNVMDQLPEVIDFLVLDSEHSFDTLSREVEMYEPRLRIGGTMFLHDTLVFPEMSPVILALRDSGRFEMITFDTPRTYRMIGKGCGVTVLIKKRSGDPVNSEPYRIRNQTPREYFANRNDDFSKMVLSNSVPFHLDTNIAISTMSNLTTDDV